ncbi:hypothetical protein BGZ70_006504 [Mortierella alpina]|uniref:Uncharacterized protein n=1 Tax=Mortierella alpina TaxID=64518 RepID=A0A9P6J7P8_MORAP|nr:hypothetical protein BGZ70_006504 [Mortierella alpina]
MAKRTLDGQPMPSFIHQIAPEPIPQTTTSLSAPSSDDPPADPQQNTPFPLNGRKSFWTQPGITAFVDWITTPENHARVYKQRSMSGERILDIQARIAEHVNAQCSTTWTWETVKQKVAYAKAQYTRAALLTRKAGETEDALQARRLDLCPYFDRFHAVYESSLPRKAPASSSSRHLFGKRVIVESSSSEASDIEDDPHHDSDDEYSGHMEMEMGERSASRSQASKDNDHGFVHKRQRQDKRHSLDTMGAILDDLKRQATAMATTNGSLRASWEQQHGAMLNLQRLEHEKALQKCVQERETMLQQRAQDGEKMLQQRVQEREKMLQQLVKELDEVYDRRRRELEVDKEEFRAERERITQRLEAERQELNDERQDLKYEQAEFKRTVLDFTGEHVRLVAENARLAALLEERPTLMAKRTLDGQPMPGIPSTIRPIAPTPTHHTAATAAAPLAALQNAVNSATTKKSFWRQPGMAAFVDWITHPANFDRLYRPKANSNEKSRYILEDIAEYVNSKDNTAWTGGTVKQKLYYAKSQYSKAAQLMANIPTGYNAVVDDNDDDPLEARKLELCPFFDRFHAVYSPKSNADLPPPRQSGSRPENRVIVESSPETSDLEDYPHQDYDGDGYHGAVDVLEASGSRGLRENGEAAPSHKRQKQEMVFPPPEWEAYLNDLHAQVAAAQMEKNNASLLRSWEEQHQAMLDRRTEEHEKMLQRRARELDEVYDRRRKEFETEKEVFAAKERRFVAKRIAHEECHANDVAKHYERVRIFQDERVKLFGENQRLQARLEAFEALLKR